LPDVPEPVVTELPVPTPMATPATATAVAIPPTMSQRFRWLVPDEFNSGAGGNGGAARYAVG
jgi:hypothetical protein